MDKLEEGIIAVFRNVRIYVEDDGDLQLVERSRLFAKIRYGNRISDIYKWLHP